MIPLVTFAARVEVGSATPGRAGPKVAPVTEAVTLLQLHARSARPRRQPMAAYRTCSALRGIKLSLRRRFGACILRGLGHRWRFA